MTMMTVVTMTYPLGDSTVIIVTTVMEMRVLLVKIAGKHIPKSEKNRDKKR